jgi:hypothetical protein
MAYGRGADLASLQTYRSAQPNIAGLVARAAALAGPVLAARRQTLTFGPGAAPAALERRASRLCTLLTSAIQELSACTVRDGAISCTILRHAVVLRGENPIILPQSILALDWLTLVRAKALGVRTQLEWEQGRGPLLTLLLPAERAAPAECAPAVAEGCLPA